MGERELAELIKEMEDYVENVVKNETKEESRAALIRTGILTEDGEVAEYYRGVIGDVR
ncbi:MAG: hypothetical protein FWG87_09240 [Defluviitaleaceae bacterium]|nr:hypothetical protein [Defluviitaleaceae bacterium]